MENTKIANICIIKLGALGDVVRTTPILSAIKQKYPNSKITWITKSSSVDIIKENPLVDKIVILEEIDKLRGLSTKKLDIGDKFDLLYNFDIEQDATKMANKINSVQKLGFYDNEGFASAFNSGAGYYLNTLFDDELKKSNKKTYQQMMFDVAELAYNKQEPIITISDNSRNNIDEYLSKNNLQNKKLLGLNIGSSSRWSSKSWHKDNIKEFSVKAKEKGYEIILLGGLEETKLMNLIKKELEDAGTKIYAKNTSDSLNDFFALINKCHNIISADSLALHASLALKKPTIGLFFCTPPNEIEGYGLLTKITSPKLSDFFPEKMNIYDEELTKSISVEEVLDLLK